jgi:formyltetrahydrofolate deformylase
VPVGDLSREEHEQALEKVIQPYRPDYLVLAKYMRILTPGFVKNYKNRIINIHHSFLPAFIGKNPYAQAYERGVKIIGATSHFVNESLDEGPIIVQSVISINHTQDAADLSRAGKDVEKIVLARALRLVLENRVLVQGQKTLVFE